MKFLKSFNESVQINEDVVRLKTLTLKSVWNVSKKYTGWTVEKLLENHPSTLFWAYTHVQWVTFTDDVLEVLAKKFEPYFSRIEKPGTDKAQFDKWKNKSFHSYVGKSLDELKRIHTAKNMDGKFDLELKNLIKQKELELKNTSKLPTKGTLQRINQGHKDKD